jgi:hypothetical protein
LQRYDIQAGDTSAPFYVYKMPIQEPPETIEMALVKSTRFALTTKQSGWPEGIKNDFTVPHNQWPMFTMDLERQLDQDGLRTMLLAEEAEEAKAKKTYRIPSMITNTLVMALSGGMLITLIVSSGGSVTMVGLGVVGVFASGIALFSLLMNFGTVYKQCANKNDEGEKRQPWSGADKAMWFASTAFKSFCMAFALASALGALGVIPLGHLLPILLPALMIVSMIGALVMDKQIKLKGFVEFI